MPRASEKTGDLRCKCGRLLARHDAIKCPRCGTINSMVKEFGTELKEDFWITTFLWRPDGQRASSISIRKEIWANLGNRKGVPPGCDRFPAFFVYNHLDPSKAYSPDSGCCVNAEPILKLDDALAIALQHEKEALASGRWVTVDKIDKTLRRQY